MVGLRLRASFRPAVGPNKPVRPSKRVLDSRPAGSPDTNVLRSMLTEVTSREPQRGSGGGPQNGRPFSGAFLSQARIFDCIKDLPDDRDYSVAVSCGR